MGYSFRRSVMTVACFAALVAARESSVFLYATEADDKAASLLSERGGGGGRVGGYHSSAESYRGGGDRNLEQNRSNVNSENFNRQDYTHDNYNRDNWNRSEWNQDWNGAGDGWGVDAVVPGEYVYPGTPAPTTSGDMDTLYDYENANPSSPGN